MTTPIDLVVEEPQLRLVSAEGRAALDSVRGLPVLRAVAKLRYGPGRTCEPLARLIETAVSRAERASISPEHLVVSGGSIEAAEDIVRVRRKAHGKADWISSPTSRVRIDVCPLGWYESTASRQSSPRDASPLVAVTEQRESGQAAQIRETLRNVIDPDLGVNIVDLGFVRRVEIVGGSAVITMTLTSAACPLTGIMSDQIRTEVVDRGRLVPDFRIEWVWVPSWQPADITDDGRDQLRAIGFTL